MRDIDDEIAQASTGLSQRGRCGLHPFDVPAPSLAPGPKARLAEDDCRANSALGGIVRRLDALPLDEGPQRRFRSQDPSAHTGRLVPDAPRAFLDVRDVLGLRAFRCSISAPCFPITDACFRASSSSRQAGRSAPHSSDTTGRVPGHLPRPRPSAHLAHGWPGTLGIPEAPVRRASGKFLELGLDRLAPVAYTFPLRSAAVLGSTLPLNACPTSGRLSSMKCAMLAALVMPLLGSAHPDDHSGEEADPLDCYCQGSLWLTHVPCAYEGTIDISVASGNSADCDDTECIWFSPTVCKVDFTWELSNKDWWPNLGVQEIQGGCDSASRHRIDVRPPFYPTPPGWSAECSYLELALLCETCDYYDAE
jgi:hypothetical protein